MKASGAPAPASPGLLAAIAAARAARVRGDLGTAARLAAEAVRRFDDAPLALCELGQVALAARLLERAEQAFAGALRHDPRCAEARLGRAELDALLGDHAAAAEQFAAVVEQGGGAPALVGLGRALVELGREDAADEAFARAVAAEPEALAPRLHRADLARLRGRMDEALAAYTAVLARAPGHALARANFGLATIAAGERVKGLTALREATAAAPDDPRLWCELVNATLVDAPEQALGHSVDGLRAHPAYAGLLAAQALALAACGRGGEARVLADPERFVQVLPLGVAGLAEAVAAEVEAHSSIRQAPLRHATREGYHSAYLSPKPGSALARLHAEVVRAAERHASGLPRAGRHPFVAGRPRETALGMWGVVLPEGGHQVPHLHPDAWLSAVFYARMPAEIRADDPDRAGWLCFGEPPPELPPIVLPRRAIAPREGLLVLFPSHLYHHTIRFSGPGRRISVAFDIAPVNRSAAR